MTGVIRARVGSWRPNGGMPGANANAGNRPCGADRNASRCVVDPDPVVLGLAPARSPGPSEKGDERIRRCFACWRPEP